MKPILILFFLFFSTLLLAKNNVIIMGYSEKSKLPLIGELNNNQGLYKDIFEKAAKNIGYELKIVRFPKKRVHRGLKNGSIDFYPGSSFSKERANYLYFLPNGLKTKEVLISLDKIKEIKNIASAQGELLVELGSSKKNWDKIYPKLTIVQMGMLPLKKVLIALEKKRGDFYIADIEPIRYHDKLLNFSKIGIKIHYNAINDKFVSMNLGFSRKSHLFKDSKNEKFNKLKSISLKNYPTKISKESIAYKLHVELIKMQKNGDIDKIKNKYF